MNWLGQVLLLIIVSCVVSCALETAEIQLSFFFPLVVLNYFF